MVYKIVWRSIVALICINVPLCTLKWYFGFPGETLNFMAIIMGALACYFLVLPPLEDLWRSRERIRRGN